MMLGSITGAVKRLMEVGGSIVGIRHGTEEPSFVVRQRSTGFDIRCYGPRIAAETTVAADEEAARNAGFRRLAAYIFGGNHADRKIPMTAPVSQRAGSGRGKNIAMTAPVSQRAADNGEWVIRFFMPADATMESLPQPDNPAVRLVHVKEETVAVRRFSGRATPDAAALQTAALLKTLRANGVEPIGTPYTWFYDPPWTVPVLRRNEIAVSVNP
jgi:SOUL heme-binding protein